MVKEKSKQVCDVEVKYKWDLKLKLKDRIFLILKEMESENLQQLKEKIGGDLLSVLKDLKFGGELDYRENKDLLLSRKRLEIIRKNLEKKLNKRVKECVEKSLEARKEELKQRFNKKENKNFQSIEEFEEYLKERKDTSYLPKLKFLNEKIQKLGIVEEIDLKNFLEDFKKNVGIKVKEQIQTDYDNLVKTDEYKGLFVQFKSIDRCIKLMDGESEIKKSNNSWFKNSLISPALTINIGGKEYIITKGQLDGKKLIEENVDDKCIIDRCMTNGKLDVKKLIKEKVVHEYIIDKCLTKGKLDGKKLIKEKVVDKLNSMAEKLNLRGEKYEDSDINSVVDVFLRPFSSEVNDFIDYYVDDILNCIENTDIVYKIFNCLVQQRKIKEEQRKIKEEQRKKKDEEERKNREISSEKVKLGKEILRIENLSKNFSDEDKETINKLVADGKAMKDREDVTAQEVKDEIDRLQRESQPLFQKYAQIAQQNAEREKEREKERLKERLKERKHKMLEKLSNLSSVLDENIKLIKGIKDGGKILERNGSLGDAIERGKTDSFVLYLEDIIAAGGLTEEERIVIESLKNYLQKPGSKFEDFIGRYSVERRELNGDFGSESDFIDISSKIGEIIKVKVKEGQLKEIFGDMKENLVGFRSWRNKLMEIDNVFVKIKERKNSMDWNSLGKIFEKKRMRKKRTGKRLTIEESNLYNDFCNLCNKLKIDMDYIAENLNIWLKIEGFKEKMKKERGVYSIWGVLNSISNNGEKNLNKGQKAFYKEFCDFCMGFVDKKTKIETINAVFDGKIPVELLGEIYEYVDDEKLMKAILNDFVESINKLIRRINAERKSKFELLQKRRDDRLSRKESEKCILGNIDIKLHEIIMSIISSYYNELLESKNSLEECKGKVESLKVEELTKLKKDLEKLEISTENFENMINSIPSEMLQFNRMIELCNEENWESCDVLDKVFEKWPEIRRLLGLKRLFNCDELSLEEKFRYSEQIVKNLNNLRDVSSLNSCHDEYLEKIFGVGYVKKTDLQKSLDKNDGIEREMHPKEKEILKNFESLLEGRENERFNKPKKLYERFGEILKLDGRREQEIKYLFGGKIEGIKSLFGEELFDEELLREYMKKCVNKNVLGADDSLYAIKSRGNGWELDFSVIQTGILKLAVEKGEIIKVLKYLGFYFDPLALQGFSECGFNDDNGLKTTVNTIIDHLRNIRLKGCSQGAGCFGSINKVENFDRNNLNFNNFANIRVKSKCTKKFGIGMSSNGFRFVGCFNNGIYVIYKVFKYDNHKQNGPYYDFLNREKVTDAEKAIFLEVSGHFWDKNQENKEKKEKKKVR